MYEIRRYLTFQQKEVYFDWSRRWRDTKAGIAVERRVGRMEQGNFGDHCRDGVGELRGDVGGRVMKDRSHDDAMAELFRDDPAYAVQLLNSILEDGDPGELFIVLRQLAKSFGGVQSVAEAAQLSPTQLYRTLSPDGNPVLSNLTAILKAMGLRLAVQAVPPPTQIS